VSDDRVTVHIEADTSGIKSGFAEAIQLLGNLDSKAQNVNDALKDAGAAARGFWERAGHELWDRLRGSIERVPDALERAVQSFAETTSQTWDLSRSTGIAVEQLQQLEFAGIDAGVGVGEIALGMRRLQNEMSAGSAETAVALGKIGLSMAEVKAQVPSEQFATIIEHLSKMEDVTERNAIAFQLLGRGGAALAPLGSSVRELMGEAERLGFVLSSEDVKAADDLGNSITKLEKVVGSTKSTFMSMLTQDLHMKEGIDSLTHSVGSLAVGMKNMDPATRTVITGALGAAGAIGFVVGEGGKMALAVASWLPVLKAAGVDLGALRSALVNGGLAFGTYFATISLGLAVGYAFGSWIRQQIDSELPGLSRALDDAAKDWLDFWDASSGVGIDDAGEPEKPKAPAQPGGGLGFVQLVTVSKEAIAANKEWAAQGVALAQAHAQQTGALHDLRAAIKAETEERNNDIVAQINQLRIVKDGVETYRDEQLAQTLNAQLANNNALAIIRLTEARQKFLAQHLGSTVESDALAMRTMAGALAEAERSGGLSAAQFAFVAKSVLELKDRGVELIPVLKEIAELQEIAASASFRVPFYDTGNELPLQSMAGTKAGKSLNALMPGLSVFDKHPIQDYHVELDKVAQSTFDWAGALDQVKNAFSVLGIEANSVLGQILGGVTAAAAAGQSLKKAISGKKMGAGDWAAAGMAVLQGAGAVWQATDKRTTGQRVMGGAMAGAAFGAQFGWQGAIVGGAVGALAGLIHHPAWAKAAKEAGRFAGVNISDELAKQIAADAKKMGVSLKAAVQLALPQIMADSGKDARTFAGAALELLNAVKSGAVPAAKGIESLGAAFASMVDAASKAGSVGDAAVVSLIRSARAAGQEIPEIAAYVKAQLSEAQAGIAAMVATYKPDKGEGGGFVSGIQLNTEQDAQDQGTIFAAVFWASVKEHGIVAASDAMRPAFESLRESIAMVGTTEMADAILGPIKAVMDLTAEGGLFRGAAEGAEGLNKALVGLANSGYLTRDSFQAVENQAQAAINQMMAGGATQEQALLASAPLLQSLLSASQNYGLELDANTQSLIAQAQAAGVAFKTEPMERMVQILEAIAVKLGADLPAAFGTTATAAASTAASASASYGSIAAQADGTASTMVNSWTTASGDLATAVGDFAEYATGEFDGLATFAGDRGQFVGLMWNGEIGQIEQTIHDTFPAVEKGFQDLEDAAVGPAEAVGGAVGGIVTELKAIPGAAVAAGAALAGLGGGGGGGGPTPNAEPKASGFDAILRTDKLFKTHRGERVSIMPASGSSPMSREIAADVATAVAGAIGAGSGTPAGGDVVIERLVVQVGDAKLYEGMARASRDGRLVIHEEAVRRF
jgi:predicted transcriptional regulator